MVLALQGGQWFRSEVQLASLNVEPLGRERSQGGGDDAEKEVGSVVWNGGRARWLEGGYKLLHTDRDGRSNGVGIIVSIEINK